MSALIGALAGSATRSTFLPPRAVPISRIIQREGEMIHCLGRLTETIEESDHPSSIECSAPAGGQPANSASCASPLMKAAQ
jgi:hypothetical protein